MSFVSHEKNLWRIENQWQLLVAPTEADTGDPRALAALIEMLGDQAER